jgi:hypothetical protein
MLGDVTAARQWNLLMILHRVLRAGSRSDTAFGGEVDYAMLVKLYGPAPEGQRRYSPAECTGAIKTPIQGHPDLKHVSTSYAERNNLNVRMHSRRMTRLTNAFSKKIENHAHAMALHFMYTRFTSEPENPLG